MSTCPNKDLLSAYIDGELVSPWKETIEQHLKKCSGCRSVYGRYMMLRRRIAAAAEPAFDTAVSFARLLAKRDTALAVKQAQKKRWDMAAAGAHWFFSSVRVPIPAVAAAVFVFVLMPLIFFLKAEYTVASVAASQASFTPILPVSLEKQMFIDEMDYGISRSGDTQESAVLTKSTLNTNAKLFTVGGFARLYSKDGQQFQPVQSTVDLKISSSSFPFMTEYEMFYAPNERISIINGK